MRQRPAKLLPGPEAGSVFLGEWVEAKRFSTTRLRAGYDLEEVDAFLGAIRDAFLGVSEPSLTADGIRSKQFSTTRLRPGYDEEEVDAFLDEVIARVRMRCAECGALVAEAGEVCAECGAPPSVRRPAAADPAARRRGRLAAAPARDAWSPPAWLRLGEPYFLICLTFFLALYLIGVIALNKTPQSTGRHPTIGWVIFFSLCGALLSLVLVEVARNQFRARQAVWPWVPILSLGLLAFVPFLWLALIRRRAADWLVFAAYLAAAVAELYFVVAGYPGGNAWSNSYVLEAGLMVVAPAHAVVAFSPAAGPSSWREARAARVAGKRQGPVMNAVAPEDLQ